ncbi:MAG TPA: sigma-70 family RNA polymerase sigma factor [Marmoricola sp.]|nr:sigma-70 family RNA polymerase sigma factor [Marmoricola sp.]
MDLTDEVVAAARAGDQDAWRVVYDVLAPRVLGYLRARGADDPEGTTSEVFLAVLRALDGRLEGGATGLRTLAFSIAHARLVDDLRRRARRPDVVPYDPAGDVRTAVPAEDTALMTVEASRALRFLDQLGEDQRTVVMLRILADLTLQETAAVLGRSVPAVKQLQRRGLLALKELMTAKEVTR